MIYANEKSHLDEQKTKDRPAQCCCRFWTLGLSFTGNTEDQWLQESRSAEHSWEASLERRQSEAQITYEWFVPHSCNPGLTSSPLSSVEDGTVSALSEGSQSSAWIPRAPLNRHIIIQPLPSDQLARVLCSTAAIRASLPLCLNRSWHWIAMTLSSSLNSSHTIFKS